MNRILPLILTLFIFSCKEVAFREPQPRGRRALSSVPEKLRGKYLTVQDNGALSNDTVIITARGYRFGYYEKVPASDFRNNYDTGILSDTLVLKSYRGYYFLSIYENPEWLLRVIKPERNGDLIYMAMEEDDVDFNDYIAKLSTELAIDSVQLENETVYYIDPPPSRLMELIEKGYFTRTTLRKIR